jgi:hypothetical protein
MYARGILGAGLAPSMTMAMDMAGKDITEKMFTAEAESFKKTKAGGYIGAAEAVTGATEKVGAGLKGEAQRLGFIGAEGFADELKRLINGITDAYSTTKTIIEVNTKFAEDQMKIAEDSRTFLGKIVHYMEAGQALQGMGMFPR